MYESFEEKEHQKEEETSGKNWSKAQRFSLLAMRSHVKNELSGKNVSYCKNSSQPFLWVFPFFRHAFHLLIF